MMDTGHHSRFQLFRGTFRSLCDTNAEHDGTGTTKYYGTVRYDARMVIICYANRMKSEQILMKLIQIILTSFLNQFGLCMPNPVKVENIFN